VDDFRALRKSHPNWLTAMERLDWFQQPALWDTFEPHLASIERLHFARGEPLMIAPGVEILPPPLERRHPPHAPLSHNTNVTVLPKEVARLWPHFRGVRIQASLDGYDAVNHYIRYPARWSVIDRHLGEMERERARLNVTRIGFHVTVQAYNILGLTD